MKALLLIFLGAIVVLFAGLGKKETRILPVAIGFLLLGLISLPIDIAQLLPWNFEKLHIPAFMIAFDRTALMFSSLLVFASIFILWLFPQRQTVGSDLTGLIMLSLCGGLILTAYTNLVMLFIGLEALSIPLYVLAGSNKSSLRSNEAAIKYFLMGAFSTALFLMGCAFLYGATGVLDLESLSRSLGMMAHLGAAPTMATAGIALVMIGLCFKISAFPFHFWSPDVYEGSPNRATVFMATVVKIAAFAAFFRLFDIAIPRLISHWGLPLAVISALTILVGNIGALRQTNVKRTLAYSSVAHAGYMLLAILVPAEEGFWALLVYGIAYVCASTITFYLINQVCAEGEEGFEAFNGFGKKNRFLGFALVVAMFSLAGIPITAGFAGKYLLFTSAFSPYSWLVMIALLGSAISIAYYFRIFKNAFFSAEEGAIATSGIFQKIAIGLAVLVILIVGCYPKWILDLGVF